MIAEFDKMQDELTFSSDSFQAYNQLLAWEWVASRGCECYKQDDRQQDSKRGEFPSKYSPGRPEFSLGLCPYMETGGGAGLVSGMGLSFIACPSQLPRNINSLQTTTLSSPTLANHYLIWNINKHEVSFSRGGAGECESSVSKYWSVRLTRSSIGCLFIFLLSAGGMWNSRLSINKISLEYPIILFL